MRAHRFLLAFLLLFLASGRTQGQQPPPTAFDPSGSDPRAIAVADELAQAIGGLDVWNRAHFLRFDWVVERDGAAVRNFRHLWDKYTGRYRVEGERDGQYVVVLFNVNSKEGTAYVDGQPVASADLQQWLDFGYQRFINDGYWFYMPLKWKDPGVHLHYEGERTIGDDTYDVVRLTYDNVGLTPDDVFWGYINKETHRMDQWRYVLKGRNEPPTIVNWSGWQEYSGVLLASERTWAADPSRRILIRNIGVYSDVEDRYFTTPDAKIDDLDTQ